MRVRELPKRANRAAAAVFTPGKIKGARRDMARWHQGFH